MTLKQCAFAAIVAATACSAQALDWADNSIGYRYGTHFAEPFNSNNIAKNIVNFTHASGYQYGSNFLNADVLLSDKKDPVDVGSNNGAQEIYVVYRHTLDLGKVYSKDFKFGPVRGFGVSGGFDWNTKRDAGYNSKKRMLVAGPTVMFDVPGFLNVSVLELWESNAPYSGYTTTSTPRYHYKAHPMLETTWGIPFNVGALPLSFEGYALFIASKGKDEFGVDTASETNIDAKLMYDASPFFGARKNAVKIGAEYQYWMNKFGNNRNGAAGKGAFARTPMIRAEYHF